MTPDTPSFVLDFILGLSVDKKWQDWAYRNYTSGHEHESLMELIVLQQPINQFEAKEIVQQIFTDMKVDADDVDYWVAQYVRYIESRLTYTSMEDVVKQLFPLHQLYIDLHLPPVGLQEFYMLYNGLQDLISDGVQWYHDQLTEVNYEDVARAAFARFRLRKDA
ncbi:hypothetical protein [Lewinella sp. 4G2]|uniref:hypothetical protein n=1 Tax=Lewinella sp. 4G2 TaxID=1803372 RepID=UPI0007B4EE9A|nr:hypothetical protein [Lewinella sp. 4G2]OAV45159.1 hypothetical protein A3850_011950 [Lewinella sp. 4G2]